jgi:hypothetical protein
MLAFLEVFMPKKTSIPQALMAYCLEIKFICIRNVCRAEIHSSVTQDFRHSKKVVFHAGGISH